MIRLTITHKLIAVFFLILTTVAGALILSRYIFSYNFHRYINESEVEKLRSLVPLLEAEYRRQETWKTVLAEPDRWADLLNQQANIRNNPPPPDRGQAGKSTPRLLMADSQLQSIIGQPLPEDKRQLVPIEIDHRIVGWLGLKKRRHYGPPAELLKRQAKHLLVLAGIVLMMTLLIALLFTRHLLKPIRLLIRGTKEITERNFSTRITPTSRDELGQLADNFNVMAQALNNYEQQRRRWLSDISHELRTPLAVLRGEIESLQDGVRQPSKENLASLHAEVLKISKLVDDLHLLSVAESDNLVCKRETVVPFAILAKILEKYRSRLRHCNIEVQENLDEIATRRSKGDADRLAQVFTNILENCCKYIQQPGRLMIRGQVEQENIHLVFVDSGPGVPEESLECLFDRLYRVDTSRNSDTGGSGLGLAICRHIVENHSGDIWAENDPEGGLAIHLLLPLSPA